MDFGRIWGEHGAVVVRIWSEGCCEVVWFIISAFWTTTGSVCTMLIGSGNIKGSWAKRVGVTGRLRLLRVALFGRTNTSTSCWVFTLPFRGLGNF
jgi:hypothetical protein